MTLFEAILSGIVQGLTEFLPISSSGHLVLLHHWFGYQSPQLLFDICLHCGTLLAVIIFFRSDIIKLFSERRLALAIGIGSIPIIVCGLLFHKFIRSSFGSVHIVGWMFLVTALWILLGSRMSRINYSLNKTGCGAPPKGENGSRRLQPAIDKEGNNGRFSNNPPFEKGGLGGITNSFSFPQALVVGISQAFAILPGVSRSGATISTGFILGLEPGQAVRFSFLLSIPAIIGGLIFEIAYINPPENPPLLLILIGAVTATLVGLGAIKLLIGAIKAKKFYLFSIYCFLLGVVTLLFS